MDNRPYRLFEIARDLLIQNGHYPSVIIATFETGRRAPFPVLTPIDKESFSHERYRFTEMGMLAGQRHADQGAVLWAAFCFEGWNYTGDDRTGQSLNVAFLDNQKKTHEQVVLSAAIIRDDSGKVVDLSAVTTEEIPRREALRCPHLYWFMGGFALETMSESERQENARKVDAYFEKTGLDPAQTSLL